MRRVSHLSDLDNKWPAYGAMTAFDVAFTIVVSASNTWTAIASSLTSGLLYRFNFQNNSELLCGESGVYKIDWNLALDALNANDNIEGGILINGTIQTGFVSHLKFANANSTSAMGAAGIVSLNAGDVVKLAINNNTAANSAVMQHASVTAFMLQK